jgi:hypothetical protein
MFSNQPEKILIPASKYVRGEFRVTPTFIYRHPFECGFPEDHIETHEAAMTPF